MNAPIAKYLFINYYRKNISLFKRQISCVTTAEITGTYAVDRRTLHRTPKEQSMLGECTLLPSDIDSVRKEIVMLPLLSQTRDSQNNFQNTAGSTVMSPRAMAQWFSLYADTGIPTKLWPFFCSLRICVYK